MPDHAFERSVMPFARARARLPPFLAPSVRLKRLQPIAQCER
jgi:hypothetical protein